MRPHHQPEEHPRTAPPRHPAVNLAKINRPSPSTPNRIPNHHLSCMPSPLHPAARCKHAPAPSPACPIAPERQYRKDVPAPSPAPQISHKQRPTVSTSTPNCIPPCVLPSRCKKARAPSPPKTAPAQAPQTACPLAPYRQS